MTRVRVFLAQSLDGFISGPDDDLSWLPDDLPDEELEAAGGLTFTKFLSQVGAIVMGRRTFDVVNGFDGDWPYGDLPILVATHRPFDPPVGTVMPVEGSIGEILDRAREFAGDKDVYLDGGGLVGQALHAAMVDEMTLTIIPILLGAGTPIAPLQDQVSCEIQHVSAPVRGVVQVCVGFSA